MCLGLQNVKKLAGYNNTTPYKYKFEHCLNLIRKQTRKNILQTFWLILPSSVIFFTKPSVLFSWIMQYLEKFFRWEGELPPIPLGRTPMVPPKKTVRILLIECHYKNKSRACLQHTVGGWRVTGLVIS